MTQVHIILLVVKIYTTENGCILQFLSATTLAKCKSIEMGLKSNHGPILIQ